MAAASLPELRDPKGFHLRRSIQIIRLAFRAGNGLPFRPLKFGNLRRNVVMTDDRLTGTAKNVGGQVEEGFGRATGDVKTQLQGKARQMEGALQDAYGQVKETAADAAEAIRERASEAEDVLRTTIEQRPYTTAAIALGIGYLIGRFGRRADD